MTSLEKAKTVFTYSKKLLSKNKKQDEFSNHGSCLGCNTPLVEGIHTCYDCRYFSDKEKKDKSKKYFIPWGWEITKDSIIKQIKQNRGMY